MKHEKMTDDELDEAKRALSAGDSSEADWTSEWGNKVFAHIAALTAERNDERAEVERLDREIDAIVDSIEQVTGATLAEDSDLAEEVCRIGRTRDELQATYETTMGAAAKLGEDNAALRERVQALEAERDTLRTSVQEMAAARFREEDRAATAERTLAAIRQRAGDVDTIAKVSETCAIMGSLGTGWDEAVHADVIERGDVEMLRNVSLGVARYVLGEDTAPEKDASEQRQECAMCPEPTTAEAFATVREHLDPRSNSPSVVASYDRAGAALSLLERRMGAMTEAIREAHGRTGCVCLTGEEGEWRCDLMKALLDLTDAPPVFMLEEVRQAFREVFIGATTDDIAKRLCERLSALRKVTP